MLFSDRKDEKYVDKYWYGSRHSQRTINHEEWYSRWFTPRDVSSRPKTVINDRMWRCVKMKQSIIRYLKYSHKLGNLIVRKKISFRLVSGVGLGNTSENIMAYLRRMEIILLSGQSFVKTWYLVFYIVYTYTSFMIRYLFDTISFWRPGLHIKHIT